RHTRSKRDWSSDVSLPILWLSTFASTLLRYWPQALACGIIESGEIRRQDDTLARIPWRLPSSPRYAPQLHTAIATSTGASSGNRSEERRVGKAGGTRGAAF